MATTVESLEGFTQMMALYSCAILEVETKLNVLNAQFNAANEYNPIDSIKTRLKSAESIEGKLARRELPLTLQSIKAELTDIAGLRVICPFVEDIYEVANYLTSQDDINVIRKKDYIKKPKKNGYRSLHLILETPVFTPSGKNLVVVEVQLRTIAMELWANLEHRMRYKKDFDPELADTLGKELRECADACAELDQRMGDTHRKIDTYNTFMQEGKDKDKGKKKK